MTVTASAAEVQVTKGGLHRSLGVWFGVAVGVGSMIGAGILRAPADVAARLPTPTLFFGAWVLGGLYALLGANASAGIALVAGIDRPLDMCRTATNTFSNLVGAAVVARAEGEKIGAT